MATCDKLKPVCGVEGSCVGWDARVWGGRLVCGMGRPCVGWDAHVWGGMPVCLSLQTHVLKCQSGERLKD